MTERFPAKRPLDRSKPVLRDASLVVVAVEGATEKSYFDHLKDLFHAPNLQLLPILAANSAPRDVVQALRDFVSDGKYAPGDALWAVHDMDHHRGQELARSIQELRQLGASLALSVPRFEVWLLWHFQDAIAEPQDLDGAVRAWLVGFGHGPIRNVAKIELSHVLTAAERARVFDTEPHHPLPPAPCSRIYRIIDDILTRRRTA